MKTARVRNPLFVALMGLSLFAAAQGMGMGHSQGDSKGMPMDRGKMHESMMGGAQGMGAMPMSGDVDRDFATMMKMHHEDAVRMAQNELEKGKDPQLREMARKMIVAQKQEIAQLDQWLKGSGK